MTSNTVLVIDDEENIIKILSLILQGKGYKVFAVKTLAEAKNIIKTNEIDVILTDLRLREEDGISLFGILREERQSQPVIILTAHGTVDSAVDAMKQGAFDYLLKPFERNEILRVIEKAMLSSQYQKHHSDAIWEDSLGQFPILGKNEKILKVRTLVEKVAPTDATVLIRGESGTGKELIAEAIHRLSHRHKTPFIKINCAAIPSTLMESELFGYERGAFTGAVTSKPGRFEIADTGTLFLDEIGEMSTEMQVKLLRVLQDRTFERVGGLRTIRVDVRLVTATNKDLEEEVKAGRFRGDLYYRLNVVPILLPPLCDRQDDIPLLIGHFLRRFCERLKKPVPEIAAETLELLVQYPWPGNIRELENIMERLVVMNDGEQLLPESLPEEILDYEENRFFESQTVSGSLKEQVKEITRRIEKKAIEDALQETSSNVTHAARKLNISRKGLQLKMKELGLR